MSREGAIDSPALASASGRRCRAPSAAARGCSPRASCRCRPFRPRALFSPAFGLPTHGTDAASHSVCIGHVQVFCGERGGGIRPQAERRRKGRGGGCTSVMHGRSRMTVDPRIRTMPGRSTSGFHRPDRHCLHRARSAVRCLGESHER